MKYVVLLLKVMGVGIVATVAALVYLLNSHEDISFYDQHFVPPQQAKPGAVRVRFMGNTNLLISDGESHILIDGWFSRPSLIELGLGSIEPDLEEISRGLELGEISKLDVVIPVHSHYDHAMDTPEVAKRTGALVLGSESTANIARGWGLAEHQIEVANDRPYQFGQFSIRLIPTKHFQFASESLREAALDDIQIAEPLIPPVNVLDYKMGGAYTVHINHPKGSILVQGSAGFVANALDGISAEVVFLGVGGIASQTKTYQDGYWEEIVETVKAKKIYPMHWDSLMDKLGDKPISQNLLMSKVLGLDSASSLNYAFERSEQNGIRAELLPMWQDVVLFE